MGHVRRGHTDKNTNKQSFDSQFQTLKKSKFCSQFDGGAVGALLEESKRGPALFDFSPM